jgi:hypothetical protein
MLVAAVMRVWSLYTRLVQGLGTLSACMVDGRGRWWSWVGPLGFGTCRIMLQVVSLAGDQARMYRAACTLHAFCISYALCRSQSSHRKALHKQSFTLLEGLIAAARCRLLAHCYHMK